MKTLIMENKRIIIKVIGCIAILFVLFYKITCAATAEDCVESNFYQDLRKMAIILIGILMISLAYIITSITEKGKLLHELKSFSAVFSLVMLIYCSVIVIKYNLFLSTLKYYGLNCISIVVLSMSVFIQLLNIKHNAIKNKKIIVCFSIIAIMSICSIFVFNFLGVKRNIEEYRDNEPETGLDIDIGMFNK